MELKIKLLEGGKMPIQATDGASNFDFFARKIQLLSERKAIIYLGVAFDIPKGYKLVVVPRSSFTHKSWILANSPGQIDEDYKGEIQMRVEAIPTDINEDIFNGFSLLYEELPFKVGERVCQGCLERKIAIDFVQVDELTESVRGEGGYGHTGK